MTRALFFVGAFLLAFAATGCSSPCEALAEEICACEPTLSASDACERRAEQTADLIDVDEAAQARCEGFLDTCDCNRLGTAAGKRGCGLAE